MSTHPYDQFTFNKNTGFRNLLNIVTTNNSQKHLKHFLKRHYIYFEDEFFNRIEEKRNAVLLKLQNNDEKIDADNEIEANSYTVTYTYIIAAIEKIFLQNNINIMTKPLSYTAKIAKRIKNKVKEELIIEFEKTFNELDEFAESIVSNEEFANSSENIAENETI